MGTKINLDYRPETYFRQMLPEREPLSGENSAMLRQKLQSMLEAGRHEEISALLIAEDISAADLKALESLHPMFMGGNYLPRTNDDEVEVARISIRSTTCDVTCVYARTDGRLIYYRVVDEYGGDTLGEQTEAQTEKPMTLGEFADFFLSAWPLLDVLEMNFEKDVDAALEFFSVESDFYPELGDLCVERVIAHFPEEENEGDEEG